MLSVTEIPKRADPSIDSNGGMQKASDILARSSDEFSSPSSSDSNSQSEKAYTKTSPRCPQRPPILWRFNPLWTWRLIYHMKTNKNIFNIITYGGMFVDLEEDGPQTQTECIKIIVEDLFGFEGCAGRKHGKDYRRNPRNFIKAVRSRFLRLKDHYKGNCIELGEICARIKRKDIPENSEIAHRIEKIKKKFPWWNAIHRLWRSSRDHNPFGDALSLEKIVDLAMRKGQEHLFLTKSRLKTIEESPEGQLIRYRMEMRARYSFDFCENSDVEVENMGTEKDRRSNIQSPGDLVDAGDQIQTDGPDNFESEKASEINVIARALGSNTSARAGPNLANDAGDESRENIVTRRYLSVDDGSDGEGKNILPRVRGI
ncbi:hypothetical protein SISNIDRAFT_321834 [Sistotremastrum niveocremeum HHB9708]|uniref:Uncharacterized protein n=2 Tax=Sistotremastraceae TaxID=3402574 RepID=A0A164MWZ5_9AGAM|nr:hypothetical protein SISNIDRAFT_321834 [Sistotremastrum niveocremeum HHB9708]KZT32803.1 hypothetical protein SISSUDRAFT_484727 [Sistotremastrum suecicum HHB10207 ss-3]